MDTNKKAVRFIKKHNIEDKFIVKDIIKLYQKYSGKIDIKLLEKIIHYNNKRIFTRYVIVKGKKYRSNSYKYLKYVFNNNEDERKRIELDHKKKSCWNIEFWLKKGFTEDEAKKEISKRQKRSLSKESLEKIKISREKNGKFREYHDNITNLNWFIAKYGEDEGHKKYERRIQVSVMGGKRSCEIRKKRGYRRDESCRTLEFWIKKGFTEDEARLKLYNIQSRSLDHFIGKYGYEEGYEKWNQKITKWLSSMKMKDENEINQKRRENAHIGYYSFLNNNLPDELYCYVLLFKDSNGIPFLKYGLTKQNNICKRWSFKYKYQIVFIEKKKTYGAILWEQSIKNKFIPYVPSIIKTTEAIEYSEKVIKEMIDIAKISMKEEIEIEKRVDNLIENGYIDKTLREDVLKKMYITYLQKMEKNIGKS